MGSSYLIEVDVQNFAPVFGTNTADNFGVEIFDGTSAFLRAFSGESLGLAPGNTLDVGTASVEFVASAPSLDIRFLSQLADDRSFTIDNAQLANVPLPAAAFLFLGALASIVSLRRRS